MYRYKLFQYLIMNNSTENTSSSITVNNTNDEPPTYSEISNKKTKNICHLENKNKNKIKNSAPPPAYASVIMESIAINTSEISTETPTPTPTSTPTPTQTSTQTSTSTPTPTQTSTFISVKPKMKKPSNKSNTPKPIINQPNKMTCSCCGCYNKESMDMRCCGICYYRYDNLDKQEQCNICPETLDVYCTSSYIVTECKPSHNTDDCDHCIPTILCLPLKLPMCFPCLLGSVFNNSINYCRGTHTNYCF